MKTFSNNTKYMSVLTVLTLAFSGCMKDIVNYCADESECEDANEADEQACIDEMKAETKVAKIYGCDSQYKDYVSCLVDESVCQEYTTGYNTLSVEDTESSVNDNTTVWRYVDNDGACATQYEDYASCMPEESAPL